MEAGSLGTSPAKPQAVLAVTATDKDIYRACSAVWNKALSLPFIKGRTLPREKNLSGTVQVPRLVQLGTV